MRQIWGFWGLKPREQGSGGCVHCGPSDGDGREGEDREVDIIRGKRESERWCLCLLKKAARILTEGYGQPGQTRIRRNIVGFGTAPETTLDLDFFFSKHKNKKLFTVNIKLQILF